MKTQKQAAQRRKSGTALSLAGSIVAGVAIILLRAGAADAQVLPATTTLWGGTADFNLFGLASMTAPSSGLILTGTAISAFTGKPVRHLWYGDSSNGVCRMDPEVDAVVPAATGIGGHQVVIQTCVAQIQTRAFTPGQLTFDGSTNTVYTVDTGRAGVGILRLHFDPAGDAGHGTIDPVQVESLMGTQAVRSALGGCPQIADPKTGAAVPLSPSSAAIGPDGNLYTGSTRDGAIIRIVSPATFDPSLDSDCQSNIQIPILSADSRIGVGHTFGLGWVGNTLFGADNLAPWIMENADQCLAPLNGNIICGAPAVGGAPMPTEILANVIPSPQAGAVSDAQYPNFPGTIIYFATLPHLTKITNAAAATNLTVETAYGGTFSLITGVTADPLDVTNTDVYVGVDPTQGAIGGAAGMYKISSLPPAPGPPLAPAGVTAVAQTAAATVNWFPVTNGQPTTSYVVRTMLAPAVTGAPATPSAIADVTVIPDRVTGVLATTTTVSRLADGVFYQFKVEACNLNGCSPFSGLSNIVTPLVVTIPAGTTTDMSIAMSAPAAVTPGTVLTYILSVHNAGPASAAQVNIADTLPVPLSQFTASQGTCTGVGGTSFTCNLGAMPANSSATVTVSVLVPSSGASISNSASVAAFDAQGVAMADPAPANNAAAATSTISVPVPEVVTDIQIVGSAQNGGPAVNLADTFTWQIKDNLGPVNAPDVVFQSTLPPSFVLGPVSATQGTCTSSGNTITCNLGTVNGGAQAVIVVNFTPTQVGTFSTTGQASFTGTDTNPANNSFTVTIGAR